MCNSGTIMKISFLTLSLLISMSTFAADQINISEVDKITNQQISELNKKCMQDNYMSEECKKLQQGKTTQKDSAKKETNTKHAYY